MFVVLAVFFTLHSITRPKHDLLAQNKPDKIIAFIIFAYIVFLAGMRNGMADTAAYIRSFNNISWNDFSTLDFSFNSGWGFNILAIFFKRFISSNVQVWLMFIAVISGLCVGVTFYKYSHNYFYSVFIFLATTDFTWLVNGIRQFLVVAILFAATGLIEKNKWFKYTLLVLFCSTIHGTALLMLPVYFFVRAKPWKPRVVLLLSVVLLILFFTPSFTALLENIFKETKYENLGEEFLLDDGANPLRVLLFCVTTFLAFVARKSLPQDDIKINIFVNMSLVTSGLYMISMVTSGILIGRLPIYTQFYQYLLLPYILDSFFDRKSRIIIYIISILLFLLYFKVASNGFYYTSNLTGFIM